MSGEFIQLLNVIFRAKEGRNDSNTSQPCQGEIDHYDFYQFALIPAVLMTLSFAVTKKRHHLLPQLWNGRPGLIFPMDTQGRSARISYACALGVTAPLLYRIVVNGQSAIRYTGYNHAVETFADLGSMLIYGLVFYPLFTSLAIGSVYGYAMGSLYVWMLLGVEVARLFQCSIVTAEIRGLTILRGLPTVLCLLYLSVTIPVRVWQAYRLGHYFDWRGDKRATIVSTLSAIRDSDEGNYVTTLFRKPVVKVHKEAGTTKERVIAILRYLIHRFIYKRKRGFRYPARLVSVLVTGAIIIYMMTVELLATLTPISDFKIEQMKILQARSTDQDVVRVASEAIRVLNAFRVCSIISTLLAAVFSLLNILHTLSSYRANLLALYKGKHSYIPPASASSNTKHCMYSIKYAGYQVAYIVWGYLIQWVFVFVLLFTLALIFIDGINQWFIWMLERSWPAIVMLLLVWFSHFLLSKFVFLQDRADSLALDNREIYFNFTYFMFFYNIFLGAASCLLRILKAMLLGLAFLSRLDSSTLSRRFEFFDPGFKAYVGYMHMKAAHTHPVLVVFCRLMLLALNAKREREDRGLESLTLSSSACPSDFLELVERDAHQTSRPGGHMPSVGSPSISSMSNSSEEERRHRRRVAARFHWHLAYTLLRNPAIRITRRHWMQMLGQANLGKTEDLA